MRRRKIRAWHLSLIWHRRGDQRRNLAWIRQYLQEWMERDDPAYNMHENINNRSFNSVVNQLRYESLIASGMSDSDAVRIAYPE